MARFQIKKFRGGIDMTALCDVGFLLVCFFLLTGKPKSGMTDRIKLPTETFNISDPESDIAEIFIVKGKCFFSIEGDDLRKATLNEMARQYGASFTADEMNKFQRMDVVNTSMNRLNSTINNYQNTTDLLTGTGVPVDSTTHNELMRWVYWGRVADARLNQRELKFAIVCDKDEPYPIVKMIISDLQSAKITKFSLVHNIKPFPK